MRISVILGHPYPKSFGHALAAQVTRALSAGGHAVAFHDLYREGFDPVLSEAELATDTPAADELVRRHCDELAAAEGIVIVHPNWWGMPPAILKGWVDRVFRPGVAYAFDDKDDGSGVPRGLLRARAAVVLTTSNTPEAREREIFGDPLETIWRNCIFGFSGVTNVVRRSFGTLAGSTAERRASWLDEAETLVLQAFSSPI